MKSVFKSVKKLLGPNLTKKIRPIGHGLKGILANFWFGSPTHQSVFRDVLGILFSYPLFNPNIKLIGINGTKGKTSTTIFIAKLLNESGVKTGYISTALIYDGEKEFLNPYKMGTIDSWKMNELLDKMRYNRCEVVILEMTSQGLEQNRHWGIRKFDTAVFLNAFPEHIEAHGSWENYLKAKSKLFSHTKKGANIFINGETKQIENFNEICDSVKPSLADSWNLEKIVEGQDFQIIKNKDIFLSIKIGNQVYDTKLVANFELMDLFFAWKVASLYSAKLLDPEVLKDIFSKIGNLPGRMEWIYDKGEILYKKMETSTFSKIVRNKTNLPNLSIIVDYAHEPESLKLVLDTFIEWKEQKRFDYIIHVLSCDGVGRDDWKKPLLGDLSYSKADFTVLTTDNYGQEDDPNSIIELLSKNYDPKLKLAKYDSSVDRLEAFKLALIMGAKQIESGKKVLIFSTGVGTEYGLTQPSGVMEWDERQKWVETLANS
jgi:UDP-N-acetylmuramoyl-L-alanyl-D-glutamate--2,6-diaminopimelate ligase